ncbi:helix-turn-helix transcriptional regulator [Schaalia sp. ZJ405]|uniref:winged helix-turn-helix transcriptional regulator n=1 Tax=unclassified Schaalia TaxID=2691889 RepID=UPI0013EC4BA3|nr:MULTISPECIES: helix-turn-helix domain-containing protein [unclassified Schaalia]QPK81385.1 helix-turn-helix transcriptional regulator [Schaalia sp. ZJ405]
MRQTPLVLVNDERGRACTSSCRGDGETRIPVRRILGLAKGPRRFNDLRHAVGGVTPKVLTQTLRALERDGLISRDEIPGVPPQVTYALTDLGHTVITPLDALRTWAQDNTESVLRNRETYDIRIT